MEKVFKYTDPQKAIEVALRSNKLMAVVLGDDGKAWVVRPALAEKLVRDGYERVF